MKAPARQYSDESVQLATRIPKDLHRKLRLHCVTVNESIMRFVVSALEERLDSLTHKKTSKVVPIKKQHAKDT